MKHPVSVPRMVAAHAVLTLLGLVTVVLVVVLRDELVRAWAEGRSPSVREALRVGGVDALDASGVQPPAFVPVALVLFVVVVSLVWVLVAFVRYGYGWARLVLSALLVFLAIATVGGINTGPPTVFVVLAGLSFVVEAAAFASLWRGPSSPAAGGDGPSTRPAAEALPT